MGFSAQKTPGRSQEFFALGCSVVNGVYLKSPGWQPIVAQKVPYSWQKKEISSHICAFAHTPTLPCIWALTSRFFSSKAWV